MPITDLQETLDNLDTEDFLTWLGVDLRMTRGSSGIQINVKTCPRCGGSSWKLYLNADSGLGNCFHGDCVGEPGYNKYTFAKAHLGSHREVLRELEAYEEELGYSKPKLKAKIEIAPPSDVALPASLALPVDGRNLHYLTARGFTNEVTEYFQWRYCQTGFFNYPSNDGRIAQQSYAERVIIPVHDLSGKLVTFQGRDLTGEHEKKYLFPPGLAGTGRYLYNGQNVIGCEHIVIGEGAFDVAAIYMSLSADPLMKDIGAVGTFGKQLSHGDTEGNDQIGALIQLKKQGLKLITMMYDGERSALDAACKTFPLLHSIGLGVKIAQLPDGKDPNEVSAFQIREAIKRAEPMNLSKINRLRMKLKFAS